VATGAAAIPATSEGKSDTAAITVTPVPVASVTVSPANASLHVGVTEQLAATLKDASDTVLTGRTVTWASSNSAVATVSPSGLVTAVGAGLASIAATSGGVQGAGSVAGTAVTKPGAGTDLAGAGVTGTYGPASF